MLDRRLPASDSPSGGAGPSRSDGDFAVTKLDDVAETIVLAVTGEIDMATGPSFRNALKNAIERSHNVVVDLEGVAFMDSTGLNALVRSAQQAQRSAGTVRVRSPRPLVRRLLDISGAGELIPIEDEP